ncbi:MAG TPA: class I SAM-dependent methyltransferase [Symbiobacteriaceae bacterium]|nr:class I SAM-dependent methyltransferase [Symbiobacteriaceae bacterium]
MELKANELVGRYIANYGIANGTEVTQEMVLRHWELERRLTRELLESNADNRWEVFERCYTNLYEEINWVNQPRTNGVVSTRYQDWADAIGLPQKRIYEVGSGRGELITYLAKLGHRCLATEVTRERGKKWAKDQLSNLEWGVTDGVHLERFAAESHFDVVISDQVIEHLHPDDIVDHFQGAFHILKPGGRYIFSTPHASVGPCDISGIMGYDTPMGMHLKEYTYKELCSAAQSAGFSKLMAVFRVPGSIRTRLGWPKPRKSRLYLSYLLVVEELLMTLRPSKLRRMLARTMRVALFSPSAFLVAEK